MRKTAITIAALVAAALFMSCQTEGSEERGNQNSSGESATATAKFDLNLPDSTKYGVGENAAIPDITETAGTSITLPSTKCFYSELTEDDVFVADYNFSGWNTMADGSGSSYKAGTSFTLNEDITFYAQYEKETADGDNSEDSESGDFLDIATTTEYKMKVGETVKLKSSWNEDCYYSIYNNEYDAISLDSDTITAQTVGTATVKITSSVNSSKAGYCIITVTSDSFSGTGLDYKMLGKWTDKKNSLVLNSDKTGSLIVYGGSNLLSDATFKWKTYSGGTGSNKYNFFEIYDSNDNVAQNDYLEKSYIITSVSSTTLKLKGYLVPFGNQETTWSKEK